MNATHPENARGRAIGLWSGFSALMSAAGPVVGGWLIDTVSWRWIFFMNVPLALGVVAIAMARIPESRGGRGGGRIDVAGAVLVTTGLGGVVFALLESSSRGGRDPLVLGLGMALVVAPLTTTVMAPATLSAERRDAVRASVDASFLGGFRVVMASMAALAIVAAGVAWATVPPGRLRGGRAGEADGPP